MSNSQWLGKSGAREDDSPNSLPEDVEKVG